MNEPASSHRLVPREGVLWILVSLALLAAGWIKGINLLMLFAYLMLALWLVNLVAATWQCRGISLRRRVLGPVFAGQPSAWDVEIENSRSHRSSGWKISDHGPEHRVNWFQDQVEPKQTIRLRVSVTLPKRGRYQPDSLEATCLHPFGLAHRSVSRTPAEPIVVLPAIGQLDVSAFHRWLERMARGEGRLHRVARPSMIHQDDLHGLRPFRPGDSPRWIHWRTSARRNENMVREFEEASGQNLILVVEPWSLPSEAGRLDDLLSLAATICWEWGRHNHDQLYLVLAGQTPEVFSGYCSREKALVMLRGLALLTNEPVAPELVVKAVSRRVLPQGAAVYLSLKPKSPLRGRLQSLWRRPVLALEPGAASEFYQPPRLGVSPRRSSGASS